MRDAELITAALEMAGKIALTFFRNNPKVWNKEDGSQLTEADVAVNDAVHALIRGECPTDGWLSEEGPDDHTRTTKQRCWIFDPIDGTGSFALGRNEWCIGLCLVENGTPTSAGVLHPTTDKLFTAQIGSATKINNIATFVTDGDDLTGARIASRPSALRRIADPTSTPYDVRHTPQISRLALLAEGAVDVVASFGRKHDWDIAPGALLVTQAGGKVTDEMGRPMVFNQMIPSQNGLVAAGVSRHAAVLKAMENPKR